MPSLSIVYIDVKINDIIVDPGCECTHQFLIGSTPFSARLYFVRIQLCNAIIVAQTEINLECFAFHCFVFGIPQYNEYN